MIFARRVPSIILVSFAIFLGCSSKSAGPEKSEQIVKDKISKDALLDESSINARMTERARDFNFCFDQERSKDSSFKTEKVMTLFTLREDRVESTGVVSVNPLSEDFKLCFSKIIKSINFEPVKSGDPVLVFYPFEYVRYKTNE